MLFRCFGTILIAVGLTSCGVKRAPSAASGARELPQEVYIWQQVWDAPVRNAIAEHATNFAGLVTLSAEVTWQQGEPRIKRVPLDYAALRASGRPVGLALRIGPYAGPFTATGQTIGVLTALAGSLIAEAKAAGLTPCELQIDFDCATAKLDGYRVWLEAIRKQVAPTPTIITALPSWLGQNSFPKLARAADGYILQVHSLERPSGPDAPFSICDPTAARRAVEQAARLGVPFRIALPTYGYLLGFASDGRLLGLSAEGPAKTWPPETRLREVRADPAAIAELVQTWTTNPPPACRGIIWYRLPISLDVINWRWPTLAAVMAGRPPRESSRVEVNRPQAALAEFSLVNDGEADLSSRPVVEVRWEHARVVASDALRHYEVADAGATSLQFRVRKQTSPGRLQPGEREAVGWLRLDGEETVRIEIKKP